MKDKDKQRRSLQPLCAFLLAFVMVLTHVMGAMEVHADDGIEAPTITKAFIGTNTISGGNLHRGKINGKNARGTIHVTLKNGDTVKATVSVTPKSGTTWTVNLLDGVTIAEGDVVTAYQEFDGQKSDVVTADAQTSKAYENKDKLKMPTGDIWIEQTSSNIVNKDEQAEAVEMFNAANTAIAGDIKSVKFSIDTAEHAYYEVTYTDGSTSGKVEATNLKIKQVTETSRSPEIGSITIVDNVVKGKLAGDGPFDGIKVQLVLNVNKEKAGQYCNENKCTVDKDSSKPVAVTLQDDGTFSYTLKAGDSLELDQIVGVSVKEPHKFVSCSTTTVQPAPIEKTEVKDPRKLTAKDKEAIDAAIKKAYTVGGVSKLPNGTGNWDGVPAVIQIDDSGNVKIFSGNDVKGNFDPNNDYKFVPETNEDGSYKVKDGAEPKITIQAKDLLKNIKPDAPAVKLSGDKKSITITPNLEVDTDAHIITVSYKDKDGNDQTTTATKADDGTWSITKGEGSVDKNGVVTLPKDKVKGDTTVTATVTDKGGIADDDTTPLTSDPGTLTVEETKADKVEALGGLDPVVMKKWVGDTVDWKKGVKAKDDAKKDKVEELLKGAKFEDVTEKKRSTSEEGDFEGKIKITFDDKSELVVEKQMLYVSNHVTSMERKDKVPTDALDVEFKLGEGTKVDNTGSGAIEGNKDKPTSYSKYKVKSGTDLKDYKLPNLNVSVIDSIKVTPQEGYTEPVWTGQDTNNPKNFVASDTNKVFTATATKTFKVTVQANGGTGDDKVETKKSGEKYTLPKGDTFTPPKNQEFAGWLVGDATTTTEPGTEITITKDTVIKASWKPIMVDVIFDKGEGSGNKDKVSVAKGSEYTLPDSEGFTPPANQKFAGWEVNGETKNVGDKITVNENTKVTAKYTPITVDVIFDKGEGSGNKDKVSVAKGSEYTLPDSEGFTPPANQKFAGWEVNGETKNIGDKITVNENTKVTAKWKAKEKPEDPSKPEPSDPKKPSAPAITWRGLWYLGEKTEPAKAVQEMEIGRHYKYLYGYVDKTVRPEGMITRSEAAALIARLAELDMTDKTKPNFKDTPSAWYNSAINIMVKKDLMFGDKNGNFRPNEPITRGEFARALYYIDKKNDKVAPFADVKGHEFEAAINQAYGNDRIAGYPDGTFKPNAYIQRAEAARILNQYANRNVNIPGMEGVKKDLIRFTDINENHWAYCEIMEAANSHEYQRAKGSQVETWLRILDIKADWE